MLVLTYLSITPLEADALAGIPLADKLAHAAFYFLVSFLFYVSCWHKPLFFKTRRTLFLFGVLFHVFYGMIIELVQLYIVPGRFGEWEDAIANAIGVFVSSFLSFFWFFNKPLLNRRN